jgi:S1-C subfamily serine protease
MPRWPLLLVLSGLAQPCLAQAPALQPATHNVSIVNASPFTIFTLHVWPAGRNDRGADRLGSSVLAGTRGWPLTLPAADGCNWQVVANYADIDGSRRDGPVVTLDACTTPELRLAPAPGLVRGGGTGFVVSQAGHVVTNAHVVNGCGGVGLRQAGAEMRLAVVEQNERADLALLRAPDRRPIRIGPPLPLRSRGKAPRLAEPLVALGYREFTYFGSQMLALSGRVVARRGQDTRALGLMDRSDPTTFVHDARTWGGNSGGPLLDYTGAVMGVHVARTAHPGTKDEPVVPLAIGIRIEAVYDLLARHGVTPLPEPPRRAEPELLAEEAEPSVLRLLCFSG